MNRTTRAALAFGWVLLAVLCALPVTGQHPLLLAAAVVVGCGLAFAAARLTSGAVGGRIPIRVRSSRRPERLPARRDHRPPHNPNCPRAPGDR